MGSFRFILGLQWGDEGKGKIVDYITESAQAVVRFQGGHNAGHTIVKNNQTFVLSLIPSGILHTHVKCYLAHGMVISFPHLYKEIQKLESQGIEVWSRLFISGNCALLLPTHSALDEAREENAGQTIGTTKRGIGPAYEDKVARRALRCFDLLDEHLFAAKLKGLMNYHNFLLEHYYHKPTISYTKVLEEFLECVKPFKDSIRDLMPALLYHQKNGHEVIFEGAQGFGLDLNYGTYPYVTSSHTTLGGALAGSGISLSHIKEIVGISKVYTTRVGKGPFVTECEGQEATILSERGVEVGSVTGRKRRCGWLDLVMLKEAVRINGIQSLCLTKIDVLDVLDVIPVCVAYQAGQDTLEYASLSDPTYGTFKPVYELLPGWKTSTRGCNKAELLPAHAKNLIRFIETHLGIPVKLISTGPERESLIHGPLRMT